MPFTLTAQQERIFAWVNLIDTKSRSRFINALRHIDRGWKIKDIDPDMAYFRGITAEEEAATGLIHAIVRRGYEHADQLRPRDHVQKMAILPFLQILQSEAKRLDDTSGIKQSIVLGNQQDPNRVKVVLTFMDDTGITWELVPDPPLRLIMTVEDAPVRLHEFLAHPLSLLASEQNTKTILDYIRERANKRNRILYASDTRLPTVRNLSDDFFLHQMEVVTLIAVVYLLIEQYKEKQEFVQTALDAFLTILGKLASGGKLD